MIWGNVSLIYIYINIGGLCLFVCLCLDHALTAKHRDTIFGMDTHVTPGSKIGYVILTSEVNWGHQRSKTGIWGHWGQIFKTTLRDAIFCMHTHMTPRNDVAMWIWPPRSREVTGGKKTEVTGVQQMLIEVVPKWKHLEMIFFAYILLLYILTSEIVTRSLQVTGGQKLQYKITS